MDKEHPDTAFQKGIPPKMGQENRTLVFDDVSGIGVKFSNVSSFAVQACRSRMQTLLSRAFLSSTEMIRTAKTSEFRYLWPLYEFKLDFRNGQWW